MAALLLGPPELCNYPNFVVADRGSELDAPKSRTAANEMALEMQSQRGRPPTSSISEAFKRFLKRCFDVLKRFLEAASPTLKRYFELQTGKENMTLTENCSPTFSTSSNPLLDFFFHVVPDTPSHRLSH